MCIYIGLNVVCVLQWPLGVGLTTFWTHLGLPLFRGPFWAGTSVFMGAEPMCPALLHAVVVCCDMWSACCSRLYVWVLPRCR